MKTKITALVISLMTTTAAWAQNEVPDTIATFDNPNQIVITTTEDGNQTITVTDSTASGKEVKYIYNISSGDNSTTFIDSQKPGKWNLNKLFTKKERRRRQSRCETIGMQGIYAGGLIPTGAHGAVTGGWEIGVNNIVAVEWSAGSGLPSASIGAGLGWEFQTIGHGKALMSEQGVLSVISLPEEAHDIKSRIKRFHFTVPLTIFLPMDDSFGLSLGGELHLNTYTTASSSWSTGEHSRESHSYKGLHQRIATVDITATLGWKDAAGVYVTYSPMKPWKDGYGSQYKTIAVGMSINF